MTRERPEFQDHTAETAPEASRPALAATAKKFGFLPSAMARLAESPAVTLAFGRMLGLWEATGFSALEKEVVTMTVAHHTGCEVCMAIHTASTSRAGGSKELVAALRAQTPLAEPKLEALRLFTRELLETKGAASTSALAAFLDAGYTRAEALEVVLGIAAYTLSTYANRLTRAPLDAPFAPYAWKGPTNETARAHAG